MIWKALGSTCSIKVLKSLNFPATVSILVVFLSSWLHCLFYDNLNSFCNGTFWYFRIDAVGPKALAPTTLSSSSGLTGKPSGVSQTPDLGSGYGSQPLNGPGVSPPWPRMNSNDVQRYTRIFSKVDTDHDGKITGEQARQLFLSWQLPKGLLTGVLDGFCDLAEFAAVCTF